MPTKHLPVECSRLLGLIGLAFMMQGVAQEPPLTTLSSRLVPSQGNQVLTHPPLAHGDPNANPAEGRFVDSTTRETVESYPELGRVVEGPGKKRILRNNLNIAASPQEAASVFYLLHLSDFQVVDEKSPALTPTNDFALDGQVFQGSYRPQGPYLTQTANAIIKAARKLADHTRHFDLAVHTGDAVENAQHNELEWFLTLLNGGTIHPDSGNKVDLIKGPSNDPNDPFISEGLATPWLSVIGNHDMLLQGNFPLALVEYLNTPQIASYFIQTFGQFKIAIPSLPTASHSRGGITPEQIYLVPPTLSVAEGIISGLNKPLALSDLPSRTDFLEDFLNYFENIPQVHPITPDPKRKAMDRCGFVKAHLQATNGVPKGHGFTETNLVKDAGCLGNYAYIPPENPVFRVVALDTNKTFGGSEGAFGKPQKPFDPKQLLDKKGSLRIDRKTSNDLSHGLVWPDNGMLLFTVPYAQGDSNPTYFNHPPQDSLVFLEEQLQLAKNNHELVIVLSHHPSDLFYSVNELRFQIEILTCSKIKKALPQMDCDPKDMTLTLGNVGEDKTLANQKVLAIAAKVIGLVLGKSFNSFPDVKQTDIDNFVQRAYFVPQLLKLMNTLNLILSLRQILPDPIEAVDTQRFRRLLANSPNVILHIAGHSHYHKILAICSNGEAISNAQEICEEKGGESGKGYYEVRTSGNADWPQEARTLEFVDNNDGTLTIYGTVFAAPLSEDTLVEQGRRLALTDILVSARRPLWTDKPEDLNVALTVAIPPETDLALDEIKGRKKTIESLSF
ncbi:MAG: hypothetical protein HY559_03595 [Gammaproteobacteria bacterium]|nr:hypothetical protein [Gammaproteobacteria bacterium]